MEITTLIILGAIVWFWFDSLKAREAGIQAVRRACEAESVQLLDETISLAKLRLARDDYGRMALLRVYQFEFSDNGENRRRGAVHLIGNRVALLNVGLRLVPSGERLH